MKVERDRFFETKKGTSHHVALSLHASAQRQATTRILGHADRLEIAISSVLIDALDKIEQIVLQQAEAEEYVAPSRRPAKHVKRRRPVKRTRKR